MAPPHYFNFYTNIADTEYYGALNIGLFGVSKLNKKGRHVWNYSISKNGPEYSFSDIVTAMITEESGVYITGRHFRENAHSDLLTHKLSHSGNLLWEYRYDNQGKNTFETSHDFIRINNQLVIAGEQQPDSAGRSDLLVIVLDADQGQVIQIDTTDYGINSYAFKLIALNDHDFYLFGIANTSSGRELIIRKYGLSTPIEDIASNYNLSLYPNPTYDVLTITSDRTINQVSVYNVTGQKIEAMEAHGRSQMNLSLTGYNPGIYYIKIHSPEGETVRKIIRIP
ncbi:MAG: T9SS type A sorting domain-containing protein [Saprospiraceae bacterium]|nr:T9SS type A sorting domain-containing protein [Saprospiraceae bacterium]